MSARILITGAQGFVGRYAAAGWLRSDPAAVIVGIGRSRQLLRSFTHRIEWAGARRRAPLPQELRPTLADERYRYLRLDLRDRPELVELLRHFGPTVVLHLAGALRDEPTRRLLSANVLGTESLFEAIAEAGITPLVVLGSTGSLYGHVPAERLPIVEEEPPSPGDPYSISKDAGERIARLLATRHSIPTMYARIFNVVGPGQDERHLCGWLARQMVAISLGSQSSLVVGPLDTTRDFIDVRDLAMALRALATDGTPGGIYNVASGVETLTEKVFTELLMLAGLPLDTAVVPRAGRPVDCPRSFADVRRLRALGYEPCFDLHRSLSDVLDYYAVSVAGSDRADGSRAAGAAP
jgi:GDP-4-dehydro-6-deoxy-D-mannose reductase